MLCLRRYPKETDMNFKIKAIALLYLGVMLFTKGHGQEDGHNTLLNFNELSKTLITKVKNHEKTNDIEEILAKTNINVLADGLDADHKRLAFWVNIYNAYIQIILRKHPDLYEDRSSFFKKDQIPIAGEVISFEKIEHGILRRSQWEYGLGYIGNLFPGELERKMRVDNPDYRIHFALNCGAKDCPPVAIYEWQKLEEQFKKGTTSYLKKTTDYNASEKTVRVTALFSWFRGDFGGTSGIKDILQQEGLIPTTKGVDIDFKNYDWTLDLDNFVPQ